MPCFKGIAVSIHANAAPLPEYGLQKQSRLSRISTYIPVPQPQLNPETSKHEAAKFAISITLLTPGHPIPYTTPKSTAANPHPRPLYAGPLPSTSSDPSKHANTVTPYIPMTNSENETIAAYIYFDGRAKEEVATLLRPGEETWVNSRWVQVPESEGGGLAEREFLFREVGLETWLNGLDLKGHDAAEKVEKRRQKFERRHRRHRSTPHGGDADTEKANRTRDTLAYGTEDQSPLTSPDDSDGDSMSDDDEPPEATGQIKVAMFRVIASGEIKKGEYSPQFDAHDDDDESDGGNKAGSNGAIDADVEHTTSFAKPKTLDPKTISTQTVTGIDGPDKPYAVFTFFYRGQRQLAKMGLFPGAKSDQKTPNTKRRSTQLDFSGLGPLKTTGTVGFSAFRDQEAEAAKRRKARRKSNGTNGNVMDEDSDDDDEDNDVDPLTKMVDADDKDVKTHLAPEDAKVTGELQAGIYRIRLKRQHSMEPDASGASSSRKSPSAGPNAGEATPEASSSSSRPVPDTVTNLLAQAFNGDSTIGSPLKKQRADDDETPDRSINFPAALGDVLGRATADQKKKETQPKIDEDEEL
ncbi:hypothetical protein F4804DRAFT_33797 [Jackrogersella minutella]|nr:hypothetical protein F4804DRAFT_33797 [Jackrogersella minutella]